MNFIFSRLAYKLYILDTNDRFSLSAKTPLTSSTFNHDLICREVCGVNQWKQVIGLRTRASISTFRKYITEKALWKELVWIAHGKSATRAAVTLFETKRSGKIKERIEKSVRT